MKQITFTTGLHDSVARVIEVAENLNAGNLDRDVQRQCSEELTRLVKDIDNLLRGLLEGNIDMSISGPVRRLCNIIDTHKGISFGDTEGVWTKFALKERDEGHDPPRLSEKIAHQIFHLRMAQTGQG